METAWIWRFWDKKAAALGETASCTIWMHLQKAGQVLVTRHWFEQALEEYMPHLRYFLLEVMHTPTEQLRDDGPAFRLRNGLVP